MKTKKKSSKKPKKWSTDKIKSMCFLMKNRDYSGWDYNIIKKEDFNKNSFSVMCESIGNMEIESSGRINSVEIKPKWRGKGIGVFLYEQVLLDNKKLICCPTEASDKAQRVHKSLMNKWQHTADIFKNEITYYPKLIKK